MLDLIWDLWQQQRIGELERQQQDAGGKVADAHERVRAVDDTVAKLMTTTAAMWSIVKEKTGATDEELLARVRKMEGEEGRAQAGQATACPQCGRMIPAR